MNFMSCRHLFSKQKHGPTAFLIFSKASKFLGGEEAHFSLEPSPAAAVSTGMSVVSQSRSHREQMNVNTRPANPGRSVTRASHLSRPLKRAFRNSSRLQASSFAYVRHLYPYTHTNTHGRAYTARQLLSPFSGWKEESPATGHSARLLPAACPAPRPGGGH